MIQDSYLAVTFKKKFSDIIFKEFIESKEMLKLLNVMYTLLRNSK